MGMQRTSPPSFIETPTQQLADLQAKFGKVAVPPQALDSFHYFTSALGTRLPGHVTAAQRAIRDIASLK